jgi:hypothetical protein
MKGRLGTFLLCTISNRMWKNYGGPRVAVYFCANGNSRGESAVHCDVAYDVFWPTIPFAGFINNRAS